MTSAPLPAATEPALRGMSRSTHGTSGVRVLATCLAAQPSSGVDALSKKNACCSTCGVKEGPAGTTASTSLGRAPPLTLQRGGALRVWSRTSLGDGVGLDALRPLQQHPHRLQVLLHAAPALSPAARLAAARGGGRARRARRRGHRRGRGARRAGVGPGEAPFRRLEAATQLLVLLAQHLQLGAQQRVLLAEPGPLCRAVVGERARGRSVATGVGGGLKPGGRAAGPTCAAYTGAARFGLPSVMRSRRLLWNACVASCNAAAVQALPPHLCYRSNVALATGLQGALWPARRPWSGRGDNGGHNCGWRRCRHDEHILLPLLIRCLQSVVAAARVVRTQLSRAPRGNALAGHI